MKKTFQIIGLISLICFSFFITEKTALVVSEMDEIMILIKENMNDYEINSKDAIVSGNTIIPGINGKVVNIDKSYKNMKANGYYNEDLFIFDYIKPNISIVDNKDKYIIKGPSEKRMISLIFILKENDNIDNILNILKNYKIGVSFAISPDFENSELINSVMNNGHNIGIYLNEEANYDYLDMVIKKVNSQANGFCIVREENEEVLKACKDKDNYTIKPVYIEENQILMNVKEKLESGSLLTFNINRELNRELSNIIIYLKSKGYEISTLENHVLE